MSQTQVDRSGATTTPPTPPPTLQDVLDEANAAAAAAAASAGAAAATPVAAPTNAAAGKTTPVDADLIPLVDSAAAFVLKKLTWANLKLAFGSFLQNQTYASFTTGGTSSAYTGAPTPAITSRTENQLFFVELHTDPTGSPTLAISGLPTRGCKYLDSTNTKQFITPTQVKAGNKHRVWDDGADYIFGDILPAPTASGAVEVRQSLQYGPITASGIADLITQAQVGATLATGVSTNGTFLASVGNGYNADGSQRNVNLTVSTVKNSGALAASTTNYMWLDAVTGAVGVVSVADVFQYGGTIAVTNNLHTYDTLNNIMYLGNGSVAAQSNRIIIAEVDTNGTVVTAIRVRPYKNQYDSGYTATLPNTATVNTRNHNLGRDPDYFRLVIKCTDPDNGFAIGNTLSFAAGGGYNGAFVMPGVGADKNTVWLSTGGASAFQTIPKGGGASITLTPADWSYKLIAGMNPT